MSEDFDASMMALALEQAREAARLDEVPIGAVVTRGEEIVARAHNLRESLCDPTAHAERLALTAAGQVLGRWRLEDCAVYSTLEPCPMCAGAIVQARIARVVYGADDPKAGACRSLYRLTRDRRLNHRCEVVPGILGRECGEILALFFQRRRPSDRLPDNPGERGRGA